MKQICRVLLVGCVALLGLGFAGRYTRYENLGNPTDYFFNVPADRVRAAMQIVEKNDPPPMRFTYDTREDFGVIFAKEEYYTKRYWTGRREKNGDVSPPEAGKIGTILAYFKVRIIPEAGGCRVKVVVEQFEQQIGRTYAIFPHFRKTGRSKEVKSDTYFEYLFLLKLGEVLGEKNMPPLKGDATDDEWAGK